MARCQLGHDIGPGQSYCSLGHPIALDAMQFTGDPYGAPPPQQGGPRAPTPPPPAPANQGGLGGQPGQGAPYGGYAQAYPQQPGQPPPGAYGQPPYGQGQGNVGYGQPAPQQPFPQGGYAHPPPPAAAGYGPPGGAPGQGQGGGGFPPGPAQAYGAPPPAAVRQSVPAPPQPAQGAPAPAAPDGPVYEPPAALPTNLPGNALRGFLVSYQLTPTGDFWALRGGRMTVGRVSANDQLDIPLADATISSHHATLTIDGTAGTVVVEDTGSTNGTYVNDEHVGFNGRRELRDGDILRFGGFQTLVKIVGAS